MKTIKAIIQFFVDLYGIIALVVLAMMLSAESTLRKVVNGFQFIAAFIVDSYAKSNTVVKKVFALVVAVSMLLLTIFGFTYLVVGVALAIASPYKVALLLIGTLVFNHFFSVKANASTENGGSLDVEVSLNGK